MLVFGFDIGCTSIGFAAIERNEENGTGRILRLGVRIFPESRDPKGLNPLNQTRRQKRMARRQLRRRRERRKQLNTLLSTEGLLPEFQSSSWPVVMAEDPYEIRAKALEEPVSLHEFGRCLYHLSKRRHFRGRDLEDPSDPENSEASGSDTEEEKNELKAKKAREETHHELRASAKTLGQYLAERGPGAKKRQVHALRADVESEFERLWEAQARHHSVLRSSALRGRVHDVIFSQKPVFWRKKTLGCCRFFPDHGPERRDPAPKASWLSQQRRMLETLNNLAIVEPETRPLTAEERDAILSRLQIQTSMTWAGVRQALAPIFKVRGENEKGTKFNLEVEEGGKLLGNPLEAKFAQIFGEGWANHPHKSAIREHVWRRLIESDYHEISRGPDDDHKRIVIRPSIQRRELRALASRSFIDDFGATSEQAVRLSEITLPNGWDAFSLEAINTLIVELQNGVRMGDLLAGAAWESWRHEHFPRRVQPTGEICDRLPSPRDPDEARRIASIRNPTVVRAHNELRKVVNNLIDFCGRKPDLIRVELARDVGLSKREREEILKGNRDHSKAREKAVEELQTNGLPTPSRDDVEKYILWRECGDFDPYSGAPICFSDLFRENLFQVEHIWPRSTSLDDSFRNKTLCHRDYNARKAKRTPFEAFGSDPEWEAMKTRVWKRVKEGKMKPGKAKRFCREEPLPEDFVARQLNDTRYAAREAVAYLKKLWVDRGPEAPVTVQPVNGRVTAFLRKIWGLNHILADDGEKTRLDHRHHAVDALVVACTDPGVTHRMSRYWQFKDRPGREEPQFDLPWEGIRGDATRAVQEVVVSHRVRRKISGPLHEETVYGDTGIDEIKGATVYRCYVTRKNVESLSRSMMEDVRDPAVREVVSSWVESRGGNPKKAFPPYPRISPHGPEVRKVRIVSRQQKFLMAEVSTGNADLGSNHHMAIYRDEKGKVLYEVVSLLEAARRSRRRESVVKKSIPGSTFVLSLAPGEVVDIPSGDNRGRWLVTSVWSNGPIVLKDLNDASKNEKESAFRCFRPNANSLLSMGCRKISIDPIGRIRPAND